MAGVAEGVVRGSGADAVVGEAPHEVAQERQQEGGGRGRGGPPTGLGSMTWEDRIRENTEHENRSSSSEFGDGTKHKVVETQRETTGGTTYSHERIDVTTVPSDGWW